MQPSELWHAPDGGMMARLPAPVACVHAAALPGEVAAMLLDRARAHAAA